MLLYEKKIGYLSLYHDEERKSSVGFLRISRERNACRMEMHIKKNAEVCNGSYALMLVLQDRELPWGYVTIRKEEDYTEKLFPMQGDMFCAEGERIREEDVCGISVSLGDGRWISGFWKEAGGKTDRPLKEKQDLHAAGIHLPEDKWGQLQKSYKTVHPFGDDRIFISVELRDLRLLKPAYQRLANNSFLLHGFYNYRHLILGPDRELGSSDGFCFYLGVPGTYFEREKMVAVMFGFEGFECNGAVEIGKFGYYMRRVEI